MKIHSFVCRGMTIIASLSAATIIPTPTRFILPVAAASRAYPHGCLYRHPLYYTYDEREDISWADANHGNANRRTEADDPCVDLKAGVSIAAACDYPDFRRLPSKSSPLRRPYERYRLTRRLGAGKFSDVFEAADVQWEKEAEEERQRRKRKERRGRQKGGRTRTRVGKRRDWEDEISDHGETTETEEEEGEGTDTNSLVVLKVRRIFIFNVLIASYFIAIL